MTNESSAWRKFLQPLVTGLVAFLAAATLYLQRSEGETTDSRITALEIRTEALDRGNAKLGSDMDNLRTILGDVRADVSFIRGKLESKK